MHNPTVSMNTGVLDSILQANIIVQLILLILVVLSILCWSIGIAKYLQLKSIRQANELFLGKFWKVSSLDTLYEDLDQYAQSNIARIFRSTYLELKKLAESPLLMRTTGERSKPQLSGIDNLERVLRKTIEIEVSHLESKLNILATTGSTGPFVGLFGTVWGIMGSFQKIGATGSASLAVVAPGIAEALVSTAIGLAAAIPAVVLYNHFVGQIRRQEIDLNNFSADLLNVLKRNFFGEP